MVSDGRESLEEKGGHIYQLKLFDTKTNIPCQGKVVLIDNPTITDA